MEMKSLKTKKITLLQAGILVCLTLATTHCSKGLKELNIDPAAATVDQFDPNFLLSRAQLCYTGSVDFSFETWRVQLANFSTSMQHFATTLGYWGGDKYSINTRYNYAYFERAYDEQVKFIVDAYQTTKDKPQYAKIHQMIRIWKVLIFHRITDIYGDIPYFGAGMGYYTKNFTPAYDTQQAIYADLLKELEEAAAALNTAGGKSITGDMIYGGDVGKWKRFAYSLMLRLGMRLTRVDLNAAKAWTEKAVERGVMNSVSDNAFLIHDASGGRPTVNRISQVFQANAGERSYVKWSKTFIDLLKSTNDPRLSVLADVPKTIITKGKEQADYSYGTPGNNDRNIQIGLPNGYDLTSPVGIATSPEHPGPVGTDVVGKYSRPRAWLLRLNSPTFIMNYGEVELLLAEAALRGFNVGGTVSSHYQAGVKGAMQSLSAYDAAATISTADINTYLSANSLVTGQELIQINTQFWLATILNDYETFANWRRTGIPALVPVKHPNGNTGGVIPRRMLYPVSEAANNKINYEAALQRMGGTDNVLNRVWWDKQ